ARQCAARGCPCAARSIRRWCPPSARGRYSSASGSADRRRSPAPRNATLGGPGGRQRGSDLLIARQRLIDLGKQVVAGHVVSEIDGGCKTLGIGAAVTLDDHAVEPEEDAAIGLARIHLLAQCAKCLARQQETELGLPGAAHGRAQILPDLPRGPFRGLERDIAGKALGDHDVDRTLADVVALDEAVIFE